MHDKIITRIHWSFWVIGGIALIWNILGAVNFIVQMNTASLEAYNETARAIIQGRPAWATTGFAVGVFGGTLGCLLLILRKSAAGYLFIASMLGIILTMVHTLDIARTKGDFSALEAIMMIAAPLVVAVFLVWYARQARHKGWIR